jgi:hypothetical protein
MFSVEAALEEEDDSEAAESEAVQVSAIPGQPD